jgi:hypothetical protein
MAARGGSIEIKPPILAGVAIAAKQKRGLTPAGEACGMFIEWISA